MFVMYSDGINSNWKWEDIADRANKPASAIAQYLLLKQAKDHDDATIMVVKDKDHE